MKKNNQAFNLPQKSPAVTVFNTIKLQLAVILLFIPTIWLFVEVLVDQWEWQLFLLAVYSFTAALWLVFKTRKVLKEISGEQS